MLLTKKTAIAEMFMKVLENNLDPKDVGNVRDRVAIVSDSYKWKPDVVDVWMINRGDAPDYYSVHWDGHFVVGFTDRDDMRKTILDFWTSLYELVGQDKVSFYLKDKLAVEALEKQQELDRLAEEAKALEKKEKQLKNDKMFNQLKTTEDKQVVAEAVLGLIKDKQKAKKQPKKAI